MTPTPCRFCARPLRNVFADLGSTPLANSFLSAEDLERPEPTYPLKAWICDGCLLVQVPQFETPDAIFSDYAYFSSYSDTWLDHVRRYAERMIERFALGAASRVVEIASNDGYLLRFFRDAGIPVLGIEPAANVAAAAEAAGIPTRVEFFGTASAERLAAAGERADLLLGNNVLAHVPELNDFVAGMKIALAPRGVVTMEFPHLVRLVAGHQFDTIYHEHFSYFSFTTVARIFAHHGLPLFDVEELPTHGGSLRIYARHAEDGTKPETPSVAALLEREQEAGFGRLETYLSFDERVRRTRAGLLEFLAERSAGGASIAGYGAPAKGNTLLNFCGIGTETVAYTVDRNPHKQGRFLPGSHIPVHPPGRIAETRPDYLFILPWNLKQEIMQQMAGIREWGGRFFTAVPEVEVYR